MVWSGGSPPGTNLPVEAEESSERRTAPAFGTSDGRPWRTLRALGMLIVASHHQRRDGVSIWGITDDTPRRYGPTESICDRAITDRLRVHCRPPPEAAPLLPSAPPTRPAPGSTPSSQHH
jgi:hypothetical protein